MGRFLGLFLGLLFSFSAIAAVPGNAPILTIAAPGQNTQALSIPLSSLSGTGINRIFSLYGNGSASANNYFFPLYRDGVAYATGATTKAYCFNITLNETATGYGVQLISSQAAITYNTNTALTNGFFQGGASAIYVLNEGSTAYLAVPQPGGYVFGDGVHITYAGFQVASTAAVFYLHMECYEL